MWSTCAVQIPQIVYQLYHFRHQIHGTTNQYHTTVSVQYWIPVCHELSHTSESVSETEGIQELKEAQLNQSVDPMYYVRMHAKMQPDLTLLTLLYIYLL